MNNKLITKSKSFNFQGREFTTFLINEKPYWVAKEICFELNIKNHSDAVGKLKENTQKKKLSYEECKQIGLTELQNLQIGTKGIVLLTEAGVYKLAFKSDKPNAEDFTDWISEEVLPALRNTGKYDVVENKLQQIKDGKERELSLGLYQLEQVLKINPNDMLTTLAYNNMQQELTTYKQNKKLEEFENKVQAIEANQEDQKKKLESIVAIGDRVQFTNEVNRISRATATKHAEIYNLTYLKLKNLYGIDLNTRTRHKRQELQDERLNKGLRVYAPSTLKSKVNNLVLADEECLWNELGRSLYAVEQDLLNN